MAGNTFGEITVSSSIIEKACFAGSTVKGSDIRLVIDNVATLIAAWDVCVTINALSVGVELVIL